MEQINIPNTGAGHHAPITGVAVDQGGQHVATSSYDGTLRVWDLAPSGALIERAVGAHLRLVNAVSWSPTPGVLASASADKTVRVWRYEEGGLEVCNVLCRHTDDVNSVAWMPDGRHLVCVSEDGKATAWDVDSGAFLGEVSGHRAHCMMVTTSSSGRVATVGEDGRVVVLGPDFVVLASSSLPCSVEGCSWSPDGERLAIARDDGVVDVLDPDLAAVMSTRVSTSAARSVSWSPDGARLAVGSYEGGVRVLEGASLEPVLEFDDARLWTRSIAYADSLIVAGGFGSEPLVFDTTNCVLKSDGGSDLRAPNALLAVPGGILIGADSGEVVRHDLTTGCTRTLATVGSPVLSLAAGEQALFAGTYGGEVVRIASGTGAVEAVGVADAPVPSLCWLADELVAGTYNGELITYNAQTLTVRERERAHAGSVKSLAPVAGAVFAAASTDRTASVGTISDRAIVLHHGNLLNAVAVSDGLLATASRDRTVRVARLVESGADAVLPWHVEDVQVLTGADESVKCVGVISAGNRALVLAGAYDFRLYAWDIAVDEPARALPGHQIVHVFRQAASTMCAAPDGGLYVAGWDGEIVKVTAVRRGDRLEAAVETVVDCCLYGYETED